MGEENLIEILYKELKLFGISESKMITYQDGHFSIYSRKRKHATISYQKYFDDINKFEEIMWVGNSLFQMYMYKVHLLIRMSFLIIIRN